jgi:hypothetical protein
MGIRRVLAGLIVLGLASWVGQATADDERTVKVHADGAAMERRTVEVTRALMHDDSHAVRAALDALEAACRELTPTDVDVLGHRFRTLDQAMHRVIGRTTAYVDAGQFDEAFDEFVWVQRTCRQCHTEARKKGLLPADGPLWRSSGTSSNHVETTQTEREDP